VTSKPLGQTDLNITRIGIGAWAIGGGKWEFGWGPQDDTESIAAIRAALDLGVNWIDTAAAYGLGHSETRRSHRAALTSPAFSSCAFLIWKGALLTRFITSAEKR
jgi:diketogulonate reductase-like aldo/keto reductase